ncbi:MAG: hypothetical protein IPP74_10075 [Alphaproteobacteria bacterium]|jgi:predicted transcriptional regulator|nr:hypothetical protein [Alphaproteobacteria bacterium]
MITREKLLEDITRAAYKAKLTVSQLFKKADLSLTTLHRMRHGKDFYFSTYERAMAKANDLVKENKKAQEKDNQDANKEDGS